MTTRSSFDGGHAALTSEDDVDEDGDAPASAPYAAFCTSAILAAVEQGGDLERFQGFRGHEVAESAGQGV